MQNIKPKENRMGTQNIPSLLFSISFPIIISMIVQALYNIVDSIFIANFDAVDGTGALTLAFPIQTLMIAVSVGLSVGMNALLSRSLGQKNSEKANVICGQGFFLTLCGFLIFLIFGLFFAEPFVATQAEKGSLLYDYTLSYLRIVCIFSFGLFIQVVTEKLLQATGKSLLSMIVQLSGAITNIILDPILIFGWLGLPAMGAKGAAIATIIGQMVSAVLGIFLNLKYNTEIKIKIKNFIPQGRTLYEMLTIGIPAVLMQAISSVMTFAMNFILNGFSTEALNVFGIYFKLQSFIFMPVFGLNNGMVPIISYNYGAEKKTRIYKTMKLAAICAVSYMLLGFLLFQTIPGVLLKFFKATDLMLTLGKPALRTISISFIMAGFSIVSISVCQALGQSIYSLIVSIVRQLVILIPAAFLLSLSGKVNLIWWAFPIAELVGCALCITFVSMVLKKLVSKMPDLS